MAAGPLNGVRVLEFSQIIAGPLGCQLLSDLGAEVIKVEPTDGEAWRHAAPFMPAESKWFHILNRGKKSLAIDLGVAAAQEVIHRLVREVDVVVINYRPDVADRLRIDYETLSAIKPELIYVDNTAFGRLGEMANRPGYDIVIQALSGMIATVGKVDQRGIPIVPPPFADTTTGYSIATAVCAALFSRAMTGQGQKIETSLLINALTINMLNFASLPAGDAEQRARFEASLAEARAAGTSYADFLAQQDVAVRAAQPGNVYYRCFLTTDGAIAIGALSAELRKKVRAVLAIEHNRDEPGYDPYDPKQVEVDQQIVALVEDMIREKSSGYWERVFESGGVPVSRVNFPQELLSHPQVEANDYVIELDHDLSGPERLAAPPWKMSGTPVQAQGASPPLGRDTNAVLALAGYSEAEIAGLRNDGVVR
jgi:CoA:oxalate CoA-transferase